MNELVEKISMWRNELERQSAHQGIDMVFDSICVYLGEQHREVRRLNDRYEKVRNSLCSSNRERVEERDRLLEENKRLNDELESWQDLAHDRLKNWCMFAERSSKLEKENMVYKVALEEIANHETDVSSAPNEFEVRYLLSGSYGICRRIANKALEVDTK